MSVVITRKSPRALLADALREAEITPIAGPIVRTNTRAERDEAYIMGGDIEQSERGLREQMRGLEEVRIEFVPVSRTAEAEKKFRAAINGLKRVTDINTGQWRILRDYSGSDGKPRFALLAVVEVEQ